MAEPTRVAYSQSNFASTTDTAETTAASFTWQAGDVFHVLGATEDISRTLNTPTTAGANLTFSLITSVNGNDNTRAYYWRGTATGSGSGTISAARGEASNAARGISVWQYRDTDGQGTPATITGQNAKTISVMRGQANSHVIAIMADWNAVNDTTVDATPVTNGQIRVATFVSGAATFFVADWGDQGAAGTDSYGITNHTGTVDMSGIAVEILGTAGGSGVETQKTMSDTMAIADQSVSGAYLPRSFADTVITTDGSVFGARRGVTSGEVIGVNDDLVDYARRVRQAEETISLTDGFVSWRRLARISQDNVDLLDGYSRSVIGAGTVYARVLSETVELSDGLVSWRRLLRLMADNADLLDGFTKTIASAGITYVRVLSDTATLIDDAGQHWTLRMSRLSDALGLNDSVIRALARIRILGEDIEYSDGAIRFLRAVRLIDEPVDVADELIRTFFPDQVFTVALRFGSFDPFRFSHRDSALRFGGH
jgi:hypothetical protein